MPDADLWQHVILKLVVGSRAFGLDHAASDTDRRGIYLPPATRHWSLAGVPEQIENDTTQETYWELQKFITLALKANPNVLETLYSPLVEHASPFAQQVIDAREIFLSRRIHATYSHYAASQFEKMHATIRARSEPKGKHVMHLLRLLISGATALRERRIPVRVADEHRERLLAVRDGRMALDEVDAWRLALHADFDRAMTETTLPAEPDVAAANALLLAGRRAALDLTVAQAFLPVFDGALAQSETSCGIPPDTGSNARATKEDMAMTFPSPVHAFATESRYPLLFATISGAHLYGFASPDSDFDLRGVHVLPVRSVVGLDAHDETIELAGDRDGLEMDLVTHDLKKFIGLMLRRNGYVLEQLYSPLVILMTPEQEELKALGRGCITRWHAHHYLGFADTQWKLFAKESPRRVKPLLYVYRVLLTGLHLMRTGEVEANLVTLNAAARLKFIDDLIALKTSTKEKQTLADGDLALHEREYARLVAELEAAMHASTLPDTPSARPGLNELLVRVRMNTFS